MSEGKFSNFMAHRFVVCFPLTGIHRGFDLRLSKVRSLRMDCRIWNSSMLEVFEQ